MENKILPSILAADFMEMGRAIDELTASGCDFLHMDVMDGNFVPQITFGEKMIKDARARFAGTIDCHLMVAEPLAHIPAMLAAGADIVIPHWECFVESQQGKDTEIQRDNKEKSLQEVIDEVHLSGKKFGIAIDGPTEDIYAIEPFLSDLAVVLIATGKVGTAGQKMQILCLEKVMKIRGMRGGDTVNIMVDIGVNRDTILAAKNAGANWFVASSAIFKNPNGIRAGYEELAVLLH